MKLKKMMALALASTALIAAAGCGGNSEPAKSGAASGAKVTGQVTSSGSSALLPLVKDAAAKFKSKNPEVSLTLNAGGSGTGLKQVFTAKVTNWKEVGGPDEPIVLVTRPTTSGTRALFTELALAGQEEASNKSLETDDSGTLIQSVAQTKGAIGYVALPYLVNNKDVAALAIDGVAPTLENTYNGKYKVWGYEHMYTKGEPTGAVKAFLDYILSDEYGVEIEKQGYGVSSKMKK